MSRLSHQALFDPDQLVDPVKDHAAAIAACQEALTHGKTLLTEYHLEGGSPAVLARHNSWLLDQILGFIWGCYRNELGDEVAADLIAAGGYGRVELNLESDIDLLILLGNNRASNSARVNEVAERFIRFCWDIGLKVGHSIRTLKQCVEIARQDITVATNLMEARLLAGDPVRADILQQKLRSNRVWSVGKFFTTKLQEQEERHLQYGDTAYNLEPNIKESKGGLRDLHMISWVANRYFGTSDLGELVEHGFLNDVEYRALIRHRNFLWRLRNGLHYLSGRCEDRLLFDYQKELAIQLGYEQGENHLAVEQMMKAYYRTAKQMQLLNTLLLQHFQEAILASNKPRVRKINDRFQSVGNFIEATDDNLFCRQPGAMMELFLLVQKRPALKGIRASTVRQIRDNLHRIDSNFRTDPENRRLFLEMFRHQTGLTHSLRRMNSYGVLGAFFPAFGKVVGQMQHDLFHVYTVDAHSLFVLGNVRRLALAEHRHEFPNLSDLLGRQNNRERLYLAALCHDIGKGSGRDHSEVGEEITRDFCRDLGLSAYDSEFAAWLVRQHLVMSWTAQREDITDPRVIDRFAEIVGDQEHLDNLYLLTVADIRGTSPKVWTEWKGKLLSNLYMATSRRLRTGLSGVQAVNERIEARKEAISQLVSRRVSNKALHKLWDQFGDEYFLRNGPNTGAWHADVIAQTSVVDLPLVTGRPRKDINGMQILVLAPESDELLPRITSGFDQSDLNILDARIHPTRSGLSLLVFIASDPHGRSNNRKWLNETTAHIRGLLLEDETDYRSTERLLPRRLKQFDVSTNVSFSDGITGEHTIMEVVARDRPGLLFEVAKTLYECKVKLLSAKVSTVGERAEDTFFITDRDGNPVATREQRDYLQSKLIENLG